MKLELKNIAELQSGVYLKPSSDGGEAKALLLSLRDFDDNLNYLSCEIEVDITEVKEKYIIQPNHVLFSTRAKFNAFYLPKNSKDVFVASSSFVIIKPKTNVVLPEYIAWYLNQKEAQRDLAYLGQATGRVPYISLGKLAEIKINVPELSVQKQIVEVNRLLKREKEIQQQLINKKEVYIQTLLLKTSEL